MEKLGVNINANILVIHKLFGRLQPVSQNQMRRDPDLAVGFGFCWRISFCTPACKQELIVEARVFCKQITDDSQVKCSV